MTDNFGTPAVAQTQPRSPRIQRVKLQRFKRFDDATIVIPEHVVFAGPNNSGKTTVLQAIAAWDFAMRRWMEGIGDFNARNGYQRHVIERLAFSAIPLANFDLLFKDRATGHPVVVELTIEGRTVGMEFEYDSPVQLKVRPTWATAGDNLLWLRSHLLRTTIVPTMSGISREERRFADLAAIDDLLAQGRPGDVLRNLLVIANSDEAAWSSLTATIRRLFNVELLPPQTGAVLRVEYRPIGGQQFDIASAGAGFQQVLMLLALLHTRKGNVILLDEPDAHLHLFLQDAIYSELRDAAVSGGSQLLIATHSEVLINKVDPQRLCLMFGTPRLLADSSERAKLIDSLSALSHSDLMMADSARGVLYVEDYTDMELLRAFARVLEHPALRVLETDTMWKRFRAPPPDGLGELTPRDHWETLKLVRTNLPALELLDGDSRNGAPERITGDSSGMQRLRWNRYEIESYLLHPAGLNRFLRAQLGGEAAATTAARAMETAIVKLFGDAFLADPFAATELVENYMRTTKASEKTLPDWLHEAGLPEFPKSRFAEIAQAFAPEDVHPEVREKLDKICQAFGVTP